MPRHFSLAAGNQHKGPRLLLQSKGDGVVRGGIACMQRSDDIELAGQCFRLGGLGHAQIDKRHARKAQLLRQFSGFGNQFRPRLNAVDVTFRQVLEIQVIQDKSQVRLAGTMVRQGERPIGIGRKFL